MPQKSFREDLREYLLLTSAFTLFIVGFEIIINYSNTYAKILGFILMCYGAYLGRK